MIRTAIRRLALLALALVGAGCAGSTGPARHYDFFAESDPANRWSWRIEAWQARAQQEPVASVERPAKRATFLDPLRDKIGSFRDEQRRELMVRVQDWARVQARHHYVKDAPTETLDTDHWATVRDLLESNGDDCDGLDLIIYQILREFGFPEDELYRAITFREKDGLVHMVTLWFEDRRDPWVLDATGAMTRDVRRFSEVRGWVPIKVFDETRQFDAVYRPPGAVARSRP